MIDRWRTYVGIAIDVKLTQPKNDLAEMTFKYVDKMTSFRAAAYENAP